MDKKKEIETLLSLKGDTYFNQYFSNADIDRMCINIKSDIGIECGCSFTERVEDLETALKELKERNVEILTDIIRASGDFMPDDAASAIEKAMGKFFLIKTKSRNNIALTPDEVTYLVDTLEQFI
jgi:hypothetical protein